MVDDIEEDFWNLEHDHHIAPYPRGRAPNIFHTVKRKTIQLYRNNNHSSRSLSARSPPSAARKATGRKYQFDKIMDAPQFPAIFTVLTNIFLSLSTLFFVATSFLFVLSARTVVAHDYLMCALIAVAVWMGLEVLKVIVLYFYCRRHGASVFRRRFQYEVLL